MCQRQGGDDIFLALLIVFGLGMAGAFYLTFGVFFGIVAGGVFGAAALLYAQAAKARKWTCQTCAGTDIELKESEKRRRLEEADEDDEPDEDERPRKKGPPPVPKSKRRREED